MSDKNIIKVNMKKVDPKFELGKKVYVVLGPCRDSQGEITAYRTWALKDRDDNIIVIPNAVKLSIFTFADYFGDIEEDAVPFKYLTDDEEQVKRWSKVHPVKCSDEDWFKAIGQRPTFDEMIESAKEETYDSEDSLEESELGSCCADIAEIRTILIKCKEKKSLIGWEVEHLQKVLNSCSHEMPEDAPILKNILGQLNLDWS